MNDTDFDELWQLTEEAADRLITGEGRSGMHYELIALLKNKHGIMVMSREEAIKVGRRIYGEYLDAGKVEQ